MKPPVLKKIKNTKNIHNEKMIDYYSWVHQDNILDVLTDPTLLNKEVKKYLEEENKYTDYILKKQKNCKKFFLKR